MKLIAIASIGGHWVQLLRVSLALKDLDIVFVTTNESFSSMVPGRKFYSIPNASRWDKVKLISVFWRLFIIIIKERPKAILTTGAAPGLMALIAGKLLGVKTIWLDSIANAEELSLSGKIACRFADRVYTQWPELSNNKIIYAGNVIS